MTKYFNANGQDESKHVVVLYDKRTGEIRHLHEEIFLPGSKVLSKDEIEATAFKALRRHEEIFLPGSKVLSKDEIEATALKRSRSSETSRLGALYLSHHDLKPYTNYRVDLKRMSLVEVKEKQANRKKKKSQRKTK